MEVEDDEDDSLEEEDVDEIDDDEEDSEYRRMVPYGITKISVSLRN